MLSQSLAAGGGMQLVMVGLHIDDGRTRDLVALFRPDEEVSDLSLARHQCNVARPWCRLQSDFSRPPSIHRPSITPVPMKSAHGTITSSGQMRIVFALRSCTATKYIIYGRF